MIRFAMDRCDFTFTLNGKALHTFRKFEPPLETIKDARYETKSTTICCSLYCCSIQYYATR
jgi:hypothetical protein